MRSLRANYIVKRNKKSTEKEKLNFLEMFSRDVYKNRLFKKWLMSELYSSNPTERYLTMMACLGVLSWDIDKE